MEAGIDGGWEGGGGGSIASGNGSNSVDHTHRCRQNAEHTRQSRPDSGLGFQAPSLSTTTLSWRCFVVTQHHLGMQVTR